MTPSMIDPLTIDPVAIGPVTIDPVLAVPALSDPTLAGPALSDLNSAVPVAIDGGPTFHQLVIAIVPKLRIQALALTRNRTAAEDLVQDAVCNALSAQNSFIPGTNFAAWMHRILRNRFISNLRKRRDTTDIDDVPAHTFATEAPHEDRLALKELGKAMTKLPADQREALVMVVVHGMSYEALAEATGCAVGTAKSRVFRARRQLEAWLLGETKVKAPSVNTAVTLLRQAADGPQAARLS